MNAQFHFSVNKYIIHPYMSIQFSEIFTLKRMPTDARSFGTLRRTHRDFLS